MELGERKPATIVINEIYGWLNLNPVPNLGRAISTAFLSRIAPPCILPRVVYILVKINK